MPRAFLVGVDLTAAAAAAGPDGRRDLDPEMSPTHPSAPSDGRPPNSDAEPPAAQAGTPDDERRGPPADHPSGSPPHADGSSQGDGPPPNHGQGSSDNAAAGPHGRDYGETPLVVTWEVTQACELECDHCRAEAKPDRHPDELDTEAGKRLLDEVASFGSPAPVVVFSGGDPLERPDLFELVEYATDRGLRTGVTPAPTAALTEAVLDRFADLGVHRVALSLDGATPAAHDGFRGEEGSFETVRAAAEYAAEVDLGIQINTTVTATTVDDLPAIADLVESYGAAMWEVFFLVPVGRGEQLAQLTPEAADRTLEWLYRRQRGADFRLVTVEAPQYRRVARSVERAEGNRAPTVGSTGDGNGFVFVSHTGEVYPSGFLPVGVGNVREERLVDLYREASLFRSLRDPAGFDGYCGDCSHRDRCGGSRARAHATTGDPLASDPLCPLVSRDPGDGRAP